MLRIGMPHHQIAFRLGMSMDDLRLNFGPDLRNSNLMANLDITATLEWLARSGRCAAATIFWFKHFCAGPKSESQKPKKADETEQYHTGPIDPNSFVVTGPNGERKGDR